MKDRPIFFNPLRMISPKLDSEATRLEELHRQPVSAAFTFEEGLLVMLSKLIEMIRLAREAYVTNCANDINLGRQLADQVDQQEKLLLTDLACAKSAPPELCKTFVMFPSHLGRVADYSERILNCCDIKCSDGLNFSDKANQEVNQTFTLILDMMVNFRDTLIAPNKFLLDHVISQAKELDQMCQDWQTGSWPMSNVCWRAVVLLERLPCTSTCWNPPNRLVGTSKKWPKRCTVL